MEAKKLQINDLVMVDDGHEPSIGRVTMVQTTQPLSLEDGPWEDEIAVDDMRVEASCVKPIPFTEEIAIKNGFTKKIRNNRFVDYSRSVKLANKGHEGYGTRKLRITFINGIYQSSIICRLSGKDSVIDGKFTYMHELQQALRWVGLNDIADTLTV